MTLSRRHLAASSLALAALAALPRRAAAAASSAASWPTRPVRLVVPYAAGGASDIMARAVQEPLQAALGQTVVIDNRAGGGSMIGSEAAARSDDGHTFLVADGAHTIIPAVQARVPYDPVRDFVPVGNMGGISLLLAVNKAMGVRTLGEFMQAAKASPEKVTFGSSGVGSLTHLLPEYLTQLTGAKFTVVPYRGAGPALQDVVAGNINAIFSSSLAAAGPLKDELVVPLAVGAAERIAALPDVPTFRENGIELLSGNWYGILAPKSVPQEGVRRMEAALNTALDAQSVKDRMATLGIEPRARGAQAYGELLSAEFGTWARVARAAGVQVQ